MKGLNRVPLASLLAVSLAIAADSTADPSRTRQWEYHTKAVLFWGGDYQDSLNQEAAALGAKGWELVSAIPKQDTPSDYPYLVLIFKRLKEN